ncbi:MAG: hypothetical protein V3V15_09325 [Sphingorhabdus sp.]
MVDFCGADFDANAPVLVGVGEASGLVAGLDWPSPTKLAAIAVKAALADSGQAAALAGAVDCLAAMRLFEDSGMPLGAESPDNVPDAYARAAGLSPAKLIYGDVGGQSPQAMVNEIASALQRGEIKAAVIAGAEAVGAVKRARKQGRELDWSAASDRGYDDRLSDYPILSRAEIRHAIISMPRAYSLIENARRLRLGIDDAAYANEMAAMWSEFSAKSLAREHAQFARELSAEELLSDANGNYQLTSVYRRWMVAQDRVDVGGALILTTAGAARAMNIAEDKMVWLAGAGEAAEPPYSERVNLSGSDAQAFAIEAALDQAGVTGADLGPVDIYSCFPCAVFTATDVMEMPSRSYGDYTLTGGLTFFGGPGNCYSLHAIAAMVQALRGDGSKPALVTANGGVLSKHAAGVYTASQPAKPWAGGAAQGYQANKLEINHAPSGRAKILTHMRPVSRDGPGAATLIIETEQGGRALAVLEGSADANLDHATVEITLGEKRHAARLA